MTISNSRYLAQGIKQANMPLNHSISASRGTVRFGFLMSILIPEYGKAVDGRIAGTHTAFKVRRRCTSALFTIWDRLK